MHHRIPLPPALGDPFTLAEAAAAGIRRGRADAADLHRPFRGVRAAAAPTTFAELVACGARRLKPRQRFVGRTAVRLWGLPFPQRWTIAEPLDVAVPPDATPPKTAGVRGRRLNEHHADTWRIRSVPVVDPIAAVFSCAGALTLVDAVVLLDALLTAADNYPGLLRARPIARADDVRDRLQQWARFPGRGTVREALALARAGVESPKETETRLLLVGAGLAEPVVQHEVREGGRLLARIDLAYPQWRIAIEYEGDGHRTDAEQWRRDIRRQRDLEDRGWLVIRITQLDLDEPVALLDRVRRAIAARQG
ncbi:hypothetical protein [Microbacterium capsulatum]|uniref:DUF559 domain-containing protein n=1 Tax=Microbacterium capsulatum TaxID=3041921 RepID=A0ABU0XED3_9MICO|nr:hypothetical protein [Microbacterium sp. ASV81]MDQ4213476.1 hypothetical protein [Microbacterium sp. ASV81]